MADEPKKSRVPLRAVRPGRRLRGHASRRCSASWRPRSTPRSSAPTQPRYHGRHQLNRHPDGLEKCVGCELCAWACPADAIYVEGADNTEGGRFSPGERYGRVYQINYLRCIFCGLCIEACPTRALTMTNFYELADDDRGKLIFEKQQLLAPLQEGMLARAAPDGGGHDGAATTTRARWPRPPPEQQAWVELTSPSATQGVARDRRPVEGSTPSRPMRPPGRSTEGVRR